jgi:putative DNA primase/helicase
MTDRHELLDDVLAQLQAADLRPKTPLVIGKRTRCEVEGDKAPEKTGWYVIYEHMGSKGETFYCGSFGDWRSGEKGRRSSRRAARSRLRIAPS